LRAGLVAIGVFLTAIGVSALYLGHELGVDVQLVTKCNSPSSLIISCNTNWVFESSFYAEIVGAVVLALGLALTIYGALKTDKVGRPNTITQSGTEGKITQ
jgi:hypothetical protein